MKKGKEKTKVIFRIYLDDSVIALFPQFAADMSGYSCLSYEHFGQHGAADICMVVRRTRLAKPKEYRPLLNELKQIGYNLQIVKRCTLRDLQIRQKHPVRAK